MFLYPDILVVRDLVTCVGERHVAWLLHPEGEFAEIGEHTIIHNRDCFLWVTPLLPDDSFGFRVSDVTRKSIYENSNAREMVSPSIHYRSFEPLRASEEFEFLMLMRATKNEGEPSRTFRWETDVGRSTAPSEGNIGWRLIFDDFAIEPDGESMKILDPRGE